MLTNYFNSVYVKKRLCSGQTGPFIDGFAQSLQEAGYSRCTIRIHLAVASHFGHWTQDRNITIAELDEDIGREFRQHITCCKCPSKPGKYLDGASASIRLFLSYLRQIDAITSLPEKASIDEYPLLITFRQWMLQHRGVKERTLDYYNPVIRALLNSIDGDFSQFNPHFLRHFVLQQTSRKGSHAKQVTTSIRMFVRYLIVERKCPPGLEAAVPTVAQWHLSALPRYLSPDDVEQIIGTCNPSSPNGCRNRAILLLLARLGLRAGDVVRLRLDDIDWHQATIRLCGKGRRETRLPLTQELGDAILDYLKNGRPRVSTDRMFIRAIAPLEPFSNSSVVSKIVRRAIKRAGIETPFRGAHVLRHSVATKLLNDGVSLENIRMVLRHRSLETTKQYAKVDGSLLRQVVQPWPEVSHADR